MNKPLLLYFAIVFHLILSLSPVHAQIHDPRTSWLGQDQHSFFFSPFSLESAFSAGTSEAIAWSDASPFLLRSLFPAASAEGSRFFVQYNTIPEKTVSPAQLYGLFPVYTLSPIFSPFNLLYSDTFKAVSPGIRMGYFGNPVSGTDRFSASVTMEIIRTDESYFGRRYFQHFLRAGTTRLSERSMPEPLSSNISHTGLRPALSLSWEFNRILSVGTRFSWAAYRMDGRITTDTGVNAIENHIRRYSHYDMAGGVEIRPSRLNRILFTAGYLTGSSEREIDLVYSTQEYQVLSGSSFGASSTGRDVFYLAAAADHRISSYFSASLLLSWQKGIGTINGQSTSRQSTSIYYSPSSYNYRHSSLNRDSGDIDSREMRAGFILNYNGSRLNLFTGLWLSDQYEAFEMHNVQIITGSQTQITGDERTETGSVFESSTGNINRYELMRYEIPAGAGLSVFPWLDLRAAISYKAIRTGNPSENLYSETGLPGIWLAGTGSNVDPVSFGYEGTNYRTDYYFGLEVRPRSSLRISAAAQPVYNNQVESSWIASLAVEYIF